MEMSMSAVASTKATSAVENAIMDSAERWIRRGGFGAFSFRDVATEVGIKSSSVHYHFPTKDNLAASVTRRYTERVSAYMDDLLSTGEDPAKVWTRAFRGTLHSADHMCPCTVLGAAAQDLSPEVATEVKAFYKMCLGKLVGGGMSDEAATNLLATITGALVVATALNDLDAFDRATMDLMRNSNTINA
jgi:TetR/AcrR family transcriptional repressor of nem operon